MEAWVHSCVVRGNLLIYPASCGPHFEPVLVGSCDGIASVQFPFNVCQFCHDHRDEQSIYAPQSGDQDPCACIESGKRCGHDRSGETDSGDVGEAGITAARAAGATETSTRSDPAEPWVAQPFSESWPLYAKSRPAVCGHCWSVCGQFRSACGH